MIALIGYLLVGALILITLVLAEAFMPVWMYPRDAWAPRYRSLTRRQFRRLVKRTSAYGKYYFVD